MKKEILEDQLCMYKGILFHSQTFANEKEDEITYNFNCKEFTILKEKYDLVNIAGKGTDFKKAKRLMHYLAPKLYHSSWYDNHIDCNALDLLEYSLNNKEQGINCLNKAKILEECCLALGIYARRVCIMPYSPYDFDNHVVTEIYDKKLKSWIMLDPTTDGYFVDENKNPLSLLQIRNLFASDEFVTFVKATDTLKDLPKLYNKHLATNAYICKNIFFFYIDKDSTFGTTDNTLVFAPINFSIKENLIANMKYRINHLPEEYMEYKKIYESNLRELDNYIEEKKTNIFAMNIKPDNKKSL